MPGIQQGIEGLANVPGIIAPIEYKRGYVVEKGQTAHEIVIVGGGAGGLELATRLGDKLGKKKRANITLIDASPSHLWKPLLYEVAGHDVKARSCSDPVARPQLLAHRAGGKARPRDC
jgi:hypothetical protein